MFYLLNRVSPDNIPDATGSGLDFHFTEFAIGIIMGIIIGIITCIVFTSIRNALHCKEQKNEDDKQE